MKGTMILLLTVVLTGMVWAQSFTLIENQSVIGNRGICLGFDPANQKVIRSNYGNPPEIDVLHKDTLAIEGSLATGGVTWGDLGGFGMGVGPDGSIVCMDHNETGDPAMNGLVRWSDYTDASPGLCTAPASVPFPRYLTILGTGTDQVFVNAGSGTGGVLNVLTTADGNTWSIAYSVGAAAPEYGGQRGSAAYVGTGTNEYPQFIFGCDAHSGGQADGIHVHQSFGTTYVFQGDMDPTSEESDDAILSIAVDPGIPPQVGVAGEAPVLIALGHHGTPAPETALYMFDLRTREEIGVLPFTPAAGEIGWYGAIGLDTENDRVYFSIRNVDDSTVGYADYTVPVATALPTPTPPTAASGWHLYR